METSIPFTIGTFNILAHGLSEGEFLSQGGDIESINWDKRRNKVINVLAEMLTICDVVVTQENDCFFDLLNSLRNRTKINIEGIYCLKTNHINGWTQLTHARALRTMNMLNLITGDTKQKNNNPNDPDHESHYTTLNELNKKSPKFLSFNDNCGIYGQQFAQLYGRNGDDVHVSDDGIGIYYNPNMVCLQSQYDLNIHGIPIIFNKDGWLGAIFKKQNRLITVFGAHLPSGETVNDELKRIPILKEILSQANKYQYPLIAMDSNNSIHYETQYDLSETSLSLIKKYGFSDAVPNIGYECFKMRHNMGNQPKKFCLLMFDTIDKILYKNLLLIPKQYHREEFGFLKYNPNNFQTIYDIRNNATKRSEFENKCKQSTQTDDSLIMFNQFPIFQELYPNLKACSDHPPIVSHFQIQI